MGFSQDAINALCARKIKPYTRLETKMSSDLVDDPWHFIEFQDASLVHDASEFCACLSFNAVDRESKAVDPSLCRCDIHKRR